jgi:hypothetical protein
MYKTIPSGNAPYRTNVTIAPRTVPFGLVASTTVIITTTYIQAIATRYIGPSIQIEVVSGYSHGFAVMLRSA